MAGAGMARASMAGAGMEGQEWQSMNGPHMNVVGRNGRGMNGRGRNGPLMNGRENEIMKKGIATKLKKRQISKNPNEKTILNRINKNIKNIQRLL
ncbi:hypothetical protein CEXT_783541 [Caerostris extrusa]|uniref:Uncharacterized protein n=1 Tax=Caerostris extrusa TaxID=172846 RepID=A0AAV4MXJ9_CAEEX|nr:hypothetical protein CEXT_783541 [Caerostris extrusa]